MDITYLGHSSFKIKAKEGTVVTDPFDPAMVGLKYPKASADIVTISHHHPDHDKAELVGDTKKVIDTPGEYEIQNISILGFDSFHDDKKGEDRGKNTIFVIEAEDIRIAHLGDLGHGLTEKEMDELGNINILMVPVGGVYTIDARVAASIALSLSPNIIIPMHYQTAGLNADAFSQLSPVDTFLSEVGLKTEKESKLKTKSADFATEDQKVVVLSIGNG